MTLPLPIKRYLFLIGVAFSLAVCTEAQVPPTEQSVAYHANPPIVRKVQMALRNRGYYHGLVDGFLGGATGNAIQRFQIDHSIRVIPLLDPSLLVALGIAR
jgi:peptidoglycan hydrolase-like protein with peptidoglycan-binding domain